MRDYQAEINNERIRTKRDLEILEAKIQSQLDELTRVTIDAVTPTAAVNYLPNSHPEWSKLAYTTAGTDPTTAGDGNRESYNWFRQISTATTLSNAAADALKREYSGSQHSLWAANEAANGDIPIWDGVNGLILLGSETNNWDIACPLPTDFIFPGQRYYVYCELALQSGATVPSGMQFYAGFWDNTAGQRKWIEGGDFTPTISVKGIAGARTLEYKILAATDSGEEILSVAVSTTTAPSTLTSDNRVELRFTGAPGFIHYTIYRKDGFNYYKVGDIRNSIDLQFFDQVESGSTVVSESGYPTVTENRPRAYAITQDFSPSELSTSSFTPHSLTIQIPTTYDRSQTTGSNQWFRFGIDELVDTASRRGIAIRRISVSEGYGGWARSNRDLSAASSPTATATGAPVSGSPTVDPPIIGGGGSMCVVLDTIVRTSKGDCEINDVNGKDYVDNYSYQARVISTKTGNVTELVHIASSNGLKLRGSMWHRLIQSSQDATGISLKTLQEGDNVLTCIDGKYEIATIVKRFVERGNFIVKSIRLPKPHLFITNGFVSHNAKPLEDF